MSVFHQIASQSKRLLNSLIDFLLFIALVTVLGLSLGRDAVPLFGVEVLDFAVVNHGLAFLLATGYYILFETLYGKSPAKFFTQTHVVTLAGHRPTLRTIALRTLCRFIPFDPFSFLGDGTVGWHDRLSSTRVVDDAPLPWPNRDTRLSPVRVRSNR